LKAAERRLSFYPYYPPMPKKSYFFFNLLLIVLTICSCHSSKNALKNNEKTSAPIHKVKLKGSIPAVRIDVGQTNPDELVTYAEQFIGVRYVFGSIDPKKGFDCSGFLYYVFNRFGIKVPRTSEQYTNAGKEVDLSDSKRGDLILFTGSDSKSGKVGHIGIIVENKSGKITFIHSASGGNKGICYSGIDKYFAERFVKIIRIF
jgi:cell wall-associated NlpC family hydrolase